MKNGNCLTPLFAYFFAIPTPHIHYTDRHLTVAYFSVDSLVGARVVDF